MKAIGLDLPFTVSASTSFLEVHFYEVGVENFPHIRFLAWYGDDVFLPVMIRFERFIAGRIQSFWGEFGDESIGELIDSPWLEEFRSLSLENFPDSTPSSQVRHFYFIGHDVCVEVLAENFVVV